MASRFENGESITCEANNAVLDHYQEEPQRASVNLAVLCKHYDQIIFTKREKNAKNVYKFDPNLPRTLNNGEF